MADADILGNLREQVLDESQTLVGLLRRCLALGDVTGSDDLRSWAKNELVGYPDDAPLPPYRSITAPLFIDSMGGNTISKGQQINRLQVPKALREIVPESIDFRQPIQEVAQMAASSRQYQRMGYEVFSLVAAEWTKSLGPFQSINAIYYQVSTNAIAGIVDMARTSLVDTVIDLAKTVPQESVPSKTTVDTAVHVHIGSQDNNYSVSIGGSNSGVIGQGAGSVQIQNHSAPTELLPIITQIRAALADVSDPDEKADAEQAIDDFEEAASADAPDPEKVKRRWALLERVSKAIGNAVLNQAVKEGTPLVMDQIQLMM